jgi:predicted metalloprotease with PDZ domain
MKQAFFKVTIDLTAPETHRAKVRIRKASENLPGMLEFPVWTPGSYLVRDYSRHITLLEPAEKISKNRWRLKNNSPEVNYEVYCFERTVRTSFLDEHYCALVGATLLPLLHGPYEVELKIPSHWQFVSSALKFKKRGPGRYTAQVRDDDQWIDCPIVAAAPGFGGVSKFTYKGMPHHIAWVGMDCARPMKDLAEAFEKIVATTVGMFGGAPFKEYWFLLHFAHKLYGGLEHRDSQLSQFDGSTLLEGKSWDKFLHLIAHEYFHAWNVKSIRPRALGPFDYTAENYTQDIWFAEGITDYFDDVIQRDSGLFSEEAYWKERLRDASHLPDGAPAHKRRSLADTSFDAWIRYYRHDEDSVNTDVSYYTKGSVLGWCWDAHLRKKSRGRWTLAKLMKAIWKEFGIDAYEPLAAAKPGFTRSELFAFAEELTKVSHAIVDSWVTSRKPLPWREAAKQFGVTVEEKVADPVLHHLGAQVQWKNGSAILQKVISGSAAEAAMLAPNDEILAVNGTRVTENDKLLQALGRAMKKSRTIELLICRLDKVSSKTLQWRKHNGIGVEYSAK